MCYDETKSMWDGGCGEQMGQWNRKRGEWRSIPVWDWQLMLFLLSRTIQQGYHCNPRQPWPGTLHIRGFDRCAWPDWGTQWLVCVSVCLAIVNWIGVHKKVVPLFPFHTTSAIWGGDTNCRDKTGRQCEPLSIFIWFMEFRLQRHSIAGRSSSRQWDAAKGGYNGRLFVLSSNVALRRLPEPLPLSYCSNMNFFFLPQAVLPLRLFTIPALFSVIGRLWTQTWSETSSVI